MNSTPHADLIAFKRKTCVALDGERVPGCVKRAAPRTGGIGLAPIADPADFQAVTILAAFEAEFDIGSLETAVPQSAPNTALPSYSKVGHQGGVPAMIDLEYNLSKHNR
jgi:hypothetical protein